MLKKFVSESFWGRVAYHLSHRKLFSYKEEDPNYEIPAKYLGKGETYWDNSSTRENLKSDTGAISIESPSSNKVSDSEYILVNWDGDEDPENPVNWPLPYKIFFIFEIGILTGFVYMASAIYTPGVDEIMEKFGIGETMAILPLTLFVFGYGIGPMVFSPMSENARLGRTSIYIITLFIFFIL